MAVTAGALHQPAAARRHMLMHVVNSVLMGAVGTDLSCLFIHQFTKKICPGRMMMSKFLDPCRVVRSLVEKPPFVYLTVKVDELKR